ncbi:MULTISPECIES: YozQ family protein [Bacillaceae]|uniref:YozQ family protein n=1 Tax=Evansella alkalicola TaxID=745819 RepID=A0ABS6JUH6_9BACI|nr:MULTISPECIES: YozQ family protein [Bacillaceae]MBU9722196.1 YozQ family protein [Bacillus alkalicola]
MDNNHHESHTNQKEKLENAKKVAEKSYHVFDYTSSNESDKGLAITHEQVSDTFTEGTIDGKIDKLKKNGELANHHGEEIPRKGFDE